MRRIAQTVTFIGFQMSGKTTLGRLLAHDYQCQFIDTDELINQLHPTLSNEEIFKKFGEEVFRGLENQVIEGLTYENPFVLATGGGSLLNRNNALRLKKESSFIYLKTSSEILKERILQRPTLPSYLPLSNPLEGFYQIYQTRVAIYEEWADLIVQMDDLNIEQALNVIREVLHTFPKGI